jgi:hypothetical protein
LRGSCSLVVPFQVLKYATLWTMIANVWAYRLMYQFYVWALCFSLISFCYFKFRFWVFGWFRWFSFEYFIEWLTFIWNFSAKSKVYDFIFKGIYVISILPKVLFLLLRLQTDWKLSFLLTSGLLIKFLGFSMRWFLCDL